MLKKVTSIPDKKLLSHLSVLKESEVLYERGIHPESTFIFAHAMAQEVIYESLLEKRRKGLHEKIGNAIEELYKDKIDTQCEVLVEHYFNAENYDKVDKYAKMAGKKAVKSASFADAIDYARKRVTCLESLPQNENLQSRLIDARTVLGLYYIHIDYYAKAKEAVEPVVNLALKLNYRRRISQIFIILGTYYFMIEEDFPKALKYLEEALEISKELDDILSLVNSSSWFAAALAINCEFEKAIEHHQKALDINLAVNSLWGISTSKSMMAIGVYGYQGDVVRNYKTSEEAVQTAEQSGDIFSKSMAYVSMGFASFYKGSLDEAENYLLKGIEYCERINYFAWLAWANWCLAEVYIEREEFNKSQAYYNKGISLIEPHGMTPSLINVYKAALTMARVFNQEKSIDLKSLENYFTENKMKVHEGGISLYIGMIMSQIDEHHLMEAEEWIKIAIKAYSNNGMNWHLARSYAFYADLHKRKGDHLGAKESLGIAIKNFEDCGADGWVEKYEKELAGL